MTDKKSGPSCKTGQPQKTYFHLVPVISKCNPHNSHHSRELESSRKRKRDSKERSKTTLPLTHSLEALENIPMGWIYEHAILIFCLCDIDGRVL